MLTINFVKINKNARVPTRATPLSVGFDLYACIDEGGGTKFIDVGETVKIGTGIALGSMTDGDNIETQYGGFVFARSGLATSKGLAPANKVGVIDVDYRGEIIVAIKNHSKYSQVISHCDRIAQLVFMPVITPLFLEVGAINDTDRGNGGFGSTGK
jgi:dUTP pyrophosphatase